MTIMDGGVLKGATGRFTMGGGVMMSLPAAEIPESDEGISCGGDDRGFDTFIVRLVFFGRSSCSGSFIVSEADIAADAWNCGISGGGGRGICLHCSSFCACEEEYLGSEGKKGMNILGGFGVL